MKVGWWLILNRLTHWPVGWPIRQFKSAGEPGCGQEP